MQGALVYILAMLNNRSVKLLTVYIALNTPLHNIFIKKEKYHEFQFCGAITDFILYYHFQTSRILYNTMAKDDIKMTVFRAGSAGLYEFTHMSFGLSNAGSSSCRLMK